MSTRARRSGALRATLVVVVVLAAVAVLGAAAAVAPVLRTPDERVEGRVTDALEAAGVELADPVDLESSGGEAPVWTGRVRVVQADGSVAGVRVSVRPDGPSADAIPARWLFPGVDCDSPYPLSWLGDSDSSYRTTRAQLAECLSRDSRGEVLVTIAWRRAEFDPGAPDGGSGAEAASADGGADGSTDGADGSTDGSGESALGRQTWHIDPRGGVVWLHNGSGGTRGAAGGLTGAQQREVATAEGLLEAP